MHSLCQHISRAKDASTFLAQRASDSAGTRQMLQQKLLCLQKQQQKFLCLLQLQHISSALRQAEAVLLILLLVEAGLTG